MLLLDPFTLFISNALLHLALMLALAIISRLAPDILAIRLWMRGHGLMALAVALMAVMALLLPEARPPLKLLIGGLLMSALLLMLAGLRHFFGLRPLPLALRVGYVLALLGLAGLMQWSPEVPLAGVWQASVLIVLLLGCGHVLWRQRGHLRPIVLLACLASLGGMTLGLCGRLSLLVYSIFLGEQGLQWRQLSDVLGLMVAMIGGISMAMSFWLLISDRMLFTLRRMAEEDPLTGVLNRRGFQRATARMLANQPGRVAVLMLDVDHFKRINDNYGHAAGDQVLRCMGDALRDALLASDIFARLGGEEFCVVLGELDERNAEAIGERIRQRFQRKTGLLSQAEGCTLSIGMAMGTPPVDSLAELMARADLALYHSKAEGRDQLSVYADG